MTPAQRQLVKKVVTSPVVSAMLRTGVTVTSWNHSRIRNYLNRNPIAKLQLGSGGHPLPGWLNTDLLPLREGAVYLDATQPFPFDDDSFDYAHSEHMIEHFPYDGGRKMLSELLRVLKPGGQLRLSTPDLQFLVDLTHDELSPLQRDYVRWCGEHFLPDTIPTTPFTVANNYMRDWGHSCIYDRPTIEALLRDTGFTDIRSFEIGESDDPHLTGIDNASRMPDGFVALESMVYQARKPA